MSKFKINLIHIHAVLALMGYWFCNSIVGLAYGGNSPASVSILYRFIQMLISIWVLFICRKDLVIKKKDRLLWMYAIVLVMYALRMFYDMIFGPFSMTLPPNVFMENIFMTVFGVFLSCIALISSRKYIDIDRVILYIFIVGVVTIICVLKQISLTEFISLSEEERIDGGRGLSTLALVKIGAIVSLASLHLLINKHSLYSLFGLCLGLFLTFGSGSRGGLVALVLTIFLYALIQAKKNIILITAISVAIVLFFINLVPILEWLSNYFPVISKRLLMSILENDQSGRQELRQQAFQLISENPLFGYSYRLGPSETGYGCHNGMLDLFLAFGVLGGLLSVIICFIYPFILAIKNIANKEIFFPVTLMMWIIVASASSSGITNETFGFAVALLGCSIYYKKRLRYDS